MPNELVENVSGEWLLSQKGADEKINFILKELKFIRARLHELRDREEGGGMAVFTRKGPLAVSSGTLRIYNRFNRILTLDEVYCSVGTAPAGASVDVDVNENGNSILSSVVSIPAGSNTASTASFSDDAWGHGNYLTVDVDQVGSTTAGSDLTVHVVFT